MLISVTIIFCISVICKDSNVERENKTLVIDTATTASLMQDDKVWWPAFLPPLGQQRQTDLEKKELEPRPQHMMVSFVPSQVINGGFFFLKI